MGSMNRLLPLAVFCCTAPLGSVSAVTEKEPSIVRPAEGGSALTAAARAEEAEPVSKEGAATVLVSPGSPFLAQYKGVVKVETSSLEPDYSMPWTPGRFGGGRGTAFLIGRNLFLTNAHVVSNAERLYLSKYGESRKIPARVLHIAHDCDLALLSVEDDAPFKGMTPFSIGNLPKLEDEVRVIGYPVGGDRLSVTRGVVSRIDTLNYSHSIADKHLVVQIDAAINPGNSGGPVLMGDKVVGVAFQGLSNADNTGYMIPTPVIRHFLQDVKDGKYDGYVSMGVMEFPILNPAMRAKLNLPDDEKGVLVGEIFRPGPADGVLQPGDVILKLDGEDVDSSGMMNIDDEMINMNEAIERKFAGDKMKVLFQRDGQTKEAEITLAPVKSRQIVSAAYDRKPRYILSGGLLFQPADRNVIVAHKITSPEIGQELEEFMIRGGSGNKEDIVLLTGVLPDEVNEQLGDIENGIVTKVNGVELKGLNHLHELLHAAPQPEFHVIELKGNARPIILESRSLDAANKRISRRYGITSNSNLNS